MLVRVPVVKDQAKDQARNRPVGPAKPVAKTIACEPPVSVLTEVAKLLQPGDHVVIPTDAYGGTWRLVDKVHVPAGLRPGRTGE